MSALFFGVDCRRALISKGVPCLAAVALCLGLARPARAAEPFFLTQNGGFYHYVRESSTTFSSIRAKIEDGYYASRGVRNLVFYCPYEASEEYRGVPAVNFFATNPNTGTVDDFKAMTTAAHAEGMGIIAYMGVLFVDPTNAIWAKAQQDRKAGTASAEANTFLWADNDTGETQVYGGWEYSDIAESYYATSWQRPAIHLGHADGQAYVKSVLKFWMDLGVDGFEYDSIESFWGRTPSILTDVLVTYPNNYTPGPKYLMREGPLASFDNAEENDGLGLTHVLLSGDTDDRSVATDAVNGTLSVADLEAHFVKFLDARRAKGHGAKAVSNYSDMPPAERAFEAAMLAGNGAIMEIDYDEVYKLLEPAAQAPYDRVFVALARSAAEAPGASRKRLSTGTHTSAFAVFRESVDGEARALNVYNLSKQPATVTVDLSGTELATGDVPVDLTTNEAAAAVTSNQYSVSLPALGYAFLALGEMEAAAGSGGAPGSTGGSGNTGGTNTVPGGGRATGGGGSAGVTAGKSSQSGGNAGEPDEPEAAQKDDGGCGCRTNSSGTGELGALTVALLLVGMSWRRKR
jgi:hypothetical protein